MPCKAMPVQKILLYPHPALKKVCREIPAIDQDIRALVSNLLDTMRAAPGSVGVAAPQIGVTLRVCVVDVSQHRLGKEQNHGQLVMINPILLSGTGAAVMREGCMSVPDYTGDVQRYTEIEVAYLDESGEKLTLRTEGFEAVAVQHEMDHLDGVLFLDRIVSLKTGLFRRKAYK